LVLILAVMRSLRALAMMQAMLALVQITFKSMAKVAGLFQKKTKKGKQLKYLGDFLRVSAGAGLALPR